MKYAALYLVPLLAQHAFAFPGALSETFIKGFKAEERVETPNLVALLQSDKRLASFLHLTQRRSMSATLVLTHLKHQVKVI